jgi:hypothetical protein
MACSGIGHSRIDDRGTAIMSHLKEYITTVLCIVPTLSRKPSVFSFLAEHGRSYTSDPETFAGERMEQGMCYMNCTHSVLENPLLTYCEGFVSVYGVPLEHAWLLDRDGNVIDPTLTAHPEGRVTEYFGVAFSTEYLLQAAMRNKYYGLLGYTSRKTLPKLIEGKAKNWRAPLLTPSGQPCIT